MNKIIQKIVNESNIVYVFDVIYSEDTRIEEGHGSHTFYDKELISIKLKSCYINISNEENIELIHRLKKDEIKAIEQLYEDIEI